jgi:hypothetical protein
MKEPFKIYKFISNQRNKRKSIMMPILFSINENWDVEIRKISFDIRSMPNKIRNHPSLSSVKL